ncbi:hypothetical protein NADE_008137 [Nannochloris sp. 'desiccata']|nr:hypothetical protein KSW81_000036 [Chlorella desiccata (nom. nud.)]KAH7619858.1 hypothetical protein NADE_008137 [Chlorella desiccata (nom. nud.)]
MPKTRRTQNRANQNGSPHTPATNSASPTELHGVVNNHQSTRLYPRQERLLPSYTSGEPFLPPHTFTTIQEIHRFPYFANRYVPPRLATEQEDIVFHGPYWADSPAHIVAKLYQATQLLENFINGHGNLHDVLRALTLVRRQRRIIAHVWACSSLINQSSEQICANICR